MVEYKKAAFKIDPILHILYTIIKRDYKIPDYVMRKLETNKDIEGFCILVRNFMIIPNVDNETAYIHYNITNRYHWDNREQIMVSIDSIGVYDGWAEYERARIKQLHEANEKDIPNIN